MDIVHVLLRLLHIVSAFAWVGLAAAVVFYIMPTVANSGESGLRFLKSLLSKTNFGSIFAVVGGLTTLAGILLYIFSNSASYFSQTGNIVLGIGAVAGLAATIHGGAVVGRNTKVLGMALVEKLPDGEAAAADALSSLNAMVVSLISHSRISMGLMIVALICMGSARYL